MTTRTETVIAEGFTLSQLVWKLMGRQPKGYVEQVLDANPGLAALGPEIPVGTQIVFPLDSISSENDVEQAIRLWD
jgi:phage tail protein X